MKIHTTLLTLCVAALSATAIANAEADPRQVQLHGDWHLGACNHRGQACQKLKRAIEIVNGTFAAENNLLKRENEAGDVYRRSIAFNNAKRDAEALAEAVAEAYVVGYPSLEAEDEALSVLCQHRDQSCKKIKREAAVDPDAVLCNQPGHTCHNVKRAIEAIKEVLAETPVDTINASPGALAALTACNAEDGQCTKAKRAITALKDKLVVIDSY